MSRLFAADLFLVGVHLPRWLKRSACIVGLPVIAALVWAAFAPLPAGSREAIYVVPKGTSARQSAGENVPVFPSFVVLTVGVRDVLVLKNDDVAPVTLGLASVGPGQTHRESFRAEAGPFRLFPTSLRKDGLVIVVEPAPPAGWSRLAWRLRWW